MRSTALVLASSAVFGTTLASSGFSKRNICDGLNGNDCEDAITEYLIDVCQPTNSSGLPDLDAPCNIVEYLEVSCIYGAQGLVDFYGIGTTSTPTPTSSAVFGEATGDGDYYGGALPNVTASNVTQRDCLCSSHFFYELAGCIDCYNAHGAVDQFDQIPIPSISSLSASYCAASNPPTLGWADLIYSVRIAELTTVTATTYDPSSFSDPIGNSTQVSLYFTPSVTGTAALANIEATVTIPSSSDGSSITPSASVTTDSSGRIVATTASSSKGSGSVASDSSTTTKSGAGARETVVVAHVLMVAGVAALL